jgi:hypothetical protein
LQKQGGARSFEDLSSSRSLALALQKQGGAPQAKGGTMTVTGAGCGRRKRNIHQSSFSNGI